MKFMVEKMKCSGCVTTITNALQALDPNAAVSTDIENKLVIFEGRPNADAVIAALQASGYPATLTE